MKTSTFRSLIKWFGILVVVHIISFFLFDFLLSGLILPMVEDEMTQTAYLLLYIYSIILHLVTAILYVKAETNFVEYQKSLKAAIKSPDFSLLRFYQENHLTDHLLRIAVFAIAQLPFTVSYALQGFVLDQMTMLECMFVMDVGAYALCGSVILGFLLNTLTFAIIHAGTYLVNLALFKRDSDNFI
ncbi:MAG: hypothetical protein E7632_05645 [Ruminococcaceae bacterium]|nr:hypothetical protein [Oscillospiraceae bacterium]